MRLRSPCDNHRTQCYETTRADCSDRERVRPGRPPQVHLQRSALGAVLPVAMILKRCSPEYPQPGVHPPVEGASLIGRFRCPAPRSGQEPTLLRADVSCTLEPACQFAIERTAGRS